MSQLPISGEQLWLVGGSLLLVISGAMIGFFRQLPGKIWSLIERHLMVSLHVYDEDESFYWMKLWVSQRLKNTRSMTVFTRRRNNSSSYNEPTNEVSPAEMFKSFSGGESSDPRPQPTLTPAPGMYFLWLEEKFFSLYYDRRESEGQIGLQKPRESFTLRGFTRDRSVLEKIVTAARDAAIPQDGKVDVRIANYCNWRMLGRVTPRPMKSIITEDGLSDWLLDDIRKFRANAKWYADLGIPYRRGYLLTGPPGNGKSSLALGLASELGLSVRILPLSNEMNDTALIDLLNECDGRDIVLIEDVDCAFAERKSKGQSSRITFSGLLNALDGLPAQDGRLVIMTTNHPNKLDNALIRPGRIDRVIEIKNASESQAKRMFERFYPEQAAMAEEFAAGLPSDQVSMATLQGYLLARRDDPQGAINDLHTLASIKIAA